MRSKLCLCGVLAVVVVCSCSWAGIMPPHSVVEGKSIGEWGGDWYTWLLSIPTPNNPVTDTTGENANNGQQGPVFFVAGTMGGDAERTFTVPPGKYLLVPLVNICSSQLTDGWEQTEQTLRDMSKDFIDSVDLLIGKVNGVSIGNYFAYREPTPEPFEFTAVTDNPYAVPPGDSGIAVADGYWIMFEPLEQGQTLDLVFGGGVSLLGWSVQVTAHITAVSDQVATGDVYVSATAGSDLTGDGSEPNPWKTISFAMGKITGFSREVTIHLAPGRYEERVDFLPNVRLVGEDAANPEATIVAPPATQLQIGGVVVAGAENTVIENLTVELPLFAPPSITLLLVDNVKMMVDNVVLNGRDVPDSIGISILDAGSTPSSFTKSWVKRVDDGVRVVESGANFTGNTFEDIRYDAVFVRKPASKQEGADVTPVFGDQTHAADTGVNEFRNVGGYFVRNFTGQTVKAELNDWGLDTEQEIAEKMQGDVDFVPFLTSGLIPGALICVVTDIDSGNPIVNATIVLASTGYSPLTQNVDGVYTFSVLDAGDYTVTVSAPSYIPASHQISVVAGEVDTVNVPLTFSGSPGEGEGEGESEGEGEGEGEGEHAPWPWGCFGG